MTLKVLLWPNKKLHKLSTTVSYDYTKTPEFQGFVQSLTETLLYYRGVGMSAIQVGVRDRIFVMQVKNGVQAFVNPAIVETDGELTEMEEGCLSVPGYTERVMRYPGVIVEAMDLSNGETKKWDLVGIEAQCAQHEIDHMDGKTISDGWGRVTRDIVRRKIAKAVKFDPRYSWKAGT